jgi:hypothetical protein
VVDASGVAVGETDSSIDSRNVTLDVRIRFLNRPAMNPYMLRRSIRMSVYCYLWDTRSSPMRRFLVSSVTANWLSISYPMLPKGIPSTNRICGLLIAN